MSEQTMGEPHRRFDLATQLEAGLAAAQQALASGRCIVLPTDTVYGIAADALSPAAVQGLLDAKGRSRDMPPPVLIAEPAMLRALVTSVDEPVSRLIERFWPGALTLIMKAQPNLRMDLGETRGTIAVRVPADERTRQLLRRTGPLAVSSANVSGRPPAASIDEAIEQFGDAVAVYLDGGAAPGPLASTIIDLATTPTGRIVRAGALGHAELAEVLTELEDAPAPAAEEATEKPVPASTADEPLPGTTGPDGPARPDHPPADPGSQDA